ncbi:hypothetical protein [Sporosarcina sp. Marseille-Q4943]|uniref:hypothetical protein n=1 Tax=Sporosarcina sp. Marseille-Q4943 TaxID=2942204 RepID=UPI00208DD72A|nr:hypothetical protein [Sporosarcina sp. Marseille-Q4943]
MGFQFSPFASFIVLGLEWKAATPAGTARAESPAGKAEEIEAVPAESVRLKRKSGAISRM